MPMPNINDKETCLRYLKWVDERGFSFGNERYLRCRDKLIAAGLDKVVSEKPAQELFLELLPYLSDVSYKGYSCITYDVLVQAFDAAKEIDYTDLFCQPSEMLEGTTEWLSSVDDLHNGIPIQHCFGFLTFSMEHGHDKMMQLIENVSSRLTDANPNASIKWSVDPYIQYEDSIASLILILCY